MTARYACIAMDPPWHEPGGNGRGADDHYDTIASRADLARVILTAPCWRPAGDAHLWCWTTMTSLLDALWLVDALGFRYVTHAVWCKHSPRDDLFGGRTPELGIGQYFRGSHELLLLAVRGNGFAVRTEARNIPSWFAAPSPRSENGVRIHSRKPQAAYDLIERRSHGPRLEMFARTPRPGWDVWGNQVPAPLEEQKDDTDDR